MTVGKHTPAHTSMQNTFGLEHLLYSFWVVCVTDVYGCLAVLLCCLKTNPHVEEEVVLAILATVMEWRNSKEDWFLFGRYRNDTHKL